MASGTRRRKRICEDNGSEPTDCIDQAQIVHSTIETLPAEMFYQIFRKVDKKSLRNSREVCTTWRNGIDDNSKLIKSLTFTVFDVSTFLGSQLASKAKSIRFVHQLRGPAKFLENFFKTIGSTVEEIFFTLGEPLRGRGHNEWDRRKREKLMFTMMLRYCTKLSNLTITNDEHDYDFIKDCAEDPRSSVGLSTVQSLSINVSYVYFEDLRKLVLNLPNLRSLHLNCGHYLRGHFGWSFTGLHLRRQAAEKNFANLVLDHLKKYNGKLQEIWLEQTDDLNGNSLIKLLLSVGQFYPNTKIKCKPDLADLLRYKKSNDSEESGIQVNKNSCRAIQSGKFKVGTDIIDQELETSLIGLCSNLSFLDIQIDMRIPFVNLQFISELKKLEYLRIDDSRHSEEDDGFLSEIFSCGVPSVKSLKFDSACCGLGVNSLSFHLCFPNLTKLYIYNYYGDLNADFIYNLTNLDQLRSFTLENISKLTDRHLIRTYDFTNEEDGKISNLPAIAGFKSLRSLHIAECVELTDSFLVNGLALCTKLDKIKLCYVKHRHGRGVGKFTNAGLGFLQEARNFVVEDLKSSHVHKHCRHWFHSTDVFKRFKIRK